MEYFTIVTSSEEGKIGKYPQATESTRPSDWLFPPLNEKIRYDNFLNFDSYFDIILHDEAILTDIVERGSISWGMVVSERFKDLVLKFHVPPHRFYPVNVLHINQRHGYYWFHFYDDMFNYIDLKKSTFQTYRIDSFEILETLPVKSQKFIRQIEDSFSFETKIKLNKLVLTDQFPCYDIWMNNVWGFSNLISDKLLSAMESNKITGYEVGRVDMIERG